MEFLFIIDIVDVCFIGIGGCGVCLVFIGKFGYGC